MKRVLGHCLAGASLLAGAVASFAACAHDDESLFVQDVLYPTPVAAGNSCIYSADPNQTFLPRGTLDVALAQHPEYDAFFLLANQLVARSNPQQLQTETSTINIRGAVVRITDAAGTQLTSYTSLSSGTVYPSNGTVPGYAPIAATLLDKGTVDGVVASGALANRGTVTLVSYVKFFGHTLGGTYIESNEFEFPIDLCEGCLVTFSSADVDTTTPGIKLPNCLGNQSTGGSSSSSLPVPCVPGQDTYLDCSQCRGTPVCEGQYANAPPPALDAGGG